MPIVPSSKSATAALMTLAWALSRGMKDIEINKLLARLAAFKNEV